MDEIDKRMILKIIDDEIKKVNSTCIFGGYEHQLYAKDITLDHLNAIRNKISKLR